MWNLILIAFVVGYPLIAHLRSELRKRAVRRAIRKLVVWSYYAARTPSHSHLVTYYVLCYPELQRYVTTLLRHGPRSTESGKELIELAVNLDTCIRRCTDTHDINHGVWFTELRGLVASYIALCNYPTLRNPNAINLVH